MYKICSRNRKETTKAITHVRNTFKNTENKYSLQCTQAHLLKRKLLAFSPVALVSLLQDFWLTNDFFSIGNFYLLPVCTLTGDRKSWCLYYFLDYSLDAYTASAYIDWLNKFIYGKLEFNAKNVHNHTDSVNAIAICIVSSSIDEDVCKLSRSEFLFCPVEK